MRFSIALLGTALLAGCAQPQHNVASGDNILRGPAPDGTLGEQISAEFDGGCLEAGNLGDHRCEERLEILAPPEPLLTSTPTPPPPPQQDGD